MPLHASLLRTAAIAVLCGATALPGWAQERGAYLPISDPAHAVAEQLVARGALPGLAAMERPFLLSRLRAVLAGADTAALSQGDRARIRWLAEVVARPVEEDRWEASIALGAGFEAGTQPRRQLLLAEGDGELWYPLIRLRMGAEFGPFSLQFAPQRDPRRRDDPDWPDRASGLAMPAPGVGGLQGFQGVHAKSFSEIFNVGALRLPAALIRGEWRWASVEWGELERNWGPAGIPGLVISDLAYHRPEFGFTLGPQALQFQWRTAPLSDGVSSDSIGAPVARWWAMHRLRWRPSDRLELALWETTVNAEAGGPDLGRWTPLTILSRGNRIGIGDRRNVTIGVDAAWRLSPGLLLEGQFLLDDLIWENADENPYPHRFGFTLQARGGLGDDLSWRSYVTGLSGLALNTFKPEEAYLDDEIGLGRLRPDHFEAGALVTLPWGFGGNGGEPGGLLGLGLAEVGVKWRRQGIRRFTDPFPDLQRGPDAVKFPTWSPEIEREVWALVTDVDAEWGPLSVQWEAHLQHRRYPASGEESEWGAEALVTVVWRFGPWRFGGEG